MQLLTVELRAQLPKRYAQEHAEEKIVYAKFFTPWTNWTWYVLEGEPEEDDFIFFGYVMGFEEEWGYFSLNELQAARGPGGLTIERDLFFEPTPFHKLKTKWNKNGEE